MAPTLPVGRILKTRLPRPFVSAHWTLFASLLALWGFILLAQACNESPYYLEACSAVATIAIALWVGDLAHVHLKGWSRLGRGLLSATYDLVSLVLLVVAVAFPISIFLPHYSCYNNRAKVSEIILAGSTYRSVISERFELGKSLKGVGEGMSVNIEGRVTGGTVSTDGTVMVVSDNPVALVVFRPTLSEGVLTWTCTGFPLNLMPISCRALPSF